MVLMMAGHLSPSPKVRNGEIVASAGVFARRKKFQSSPFIPKTIAECA